MTTFGLRQQIHQQIDQLPDESLQQIADFTLFLLFRRKNKDKEIADWSEQEWARFSLAQIGRDEFDGEPEYTISDAREVYHP
jgi:hypothetical protein